MMDRMQRPTAAITATLAALSIAGCGSHEPQPFKEVKQPTATATTPSATVGDPGPSADRLAGLSQRQRSVLTGLVAAEEALVRRGDAVASAGTAADQVIQRVQSGYAAPSGSTPEVRRLADALGSFSGALEAIAAQDDLLPRLSVQLRLRSERLVKTRPPSAAHLLEAKREVDATLGALPRLRQGVDDAASNAKGQSSQATLDADALNEAVTSGTESATAALNGVTHAVDVGLQALAATR
jgi:hypothetical protein